MRRGCKGTKCGLNVKGCIMNFYSFGYNKSPPRCVIKMNINRNIKAPMKHFTPSDLSPSEKTLSIIRQIAYTYRAVKINGSTKSYCLN